MTKPFSPSTTLQLARHLLDTGDRAGARQLIGDVLSRDNRNLAAWTLLARASNNAREEIFCLRRILRIDPSQAWAARRLKQLGGPPARKRNINPAAIFFLAAFALSAVTLSVFGAAALRRNAGLALLPGAEAGAPSQSCQALIDRALLASDQGCAGTGANQVCYGNNTLNAQLASGASGPFAMPGDIIDVEALLSLDASPLDLANSEWGIAIFKLLANLPRTLPGQNVTFIVFGNTSIANTSGDMEAFYFTSRLGQMACERVPFDGLLVRTPGGAGLAFTANGTDLALMGTAALEAAVNEQMRVSMVEGSARVTAGGESRYVGVGQEVTVPLGGATGFDPLGPPSTPASAPSDRFTLSCTLLGINCGSTLPPTPPPGQAEATVSSALAIAGLPQAASTPGPSPSPGGPPDQSSATPGPSPTPSTTLTPGASSAAGSATRGVETLAGSTFTVTADLTSGLSPTQTPSNLPGTPTRTAAPGTIVPSPTPTRAGGSPTTATPTATPTATGADSATHTPTPTPTETATPTATSESPKVGMGAFVVFGSEGVFLESGTTVMGGDIGVNSAVSGPYLSGDEEATIGQDVQLVDAASRVFSDSLMVRQDARVHDVFYNEIDGSGTVTGVHTSPLPLPLVTQMPPVPSFAAGSQDVTVGNDSALTLQPGEYGQLLAENGATVTFTGGVYTFSSWDIRQEAQLRFSAPTEVRIAGQLQTNSQVYLGPEDSATSLTARDILVIATGINGSTGAMGADPKAMQFGQNNSIYANLYAPNGTLFVRSNSSATGAFVGRWVNIGQNVLLTLVSRFD